MNTYKITYTAQLKTGGVHAGEHTAFANNPADAIDSCRETLRAKFDVKSIWIQNVVTTHRAIETPPQLKETTNAAVKTQTRNPHPFAVTYNREISQSMKPHLDDCISAAVDFILSKYPGVDLSGVALRFSARRNRSVYHHADASIDIKVSPKMYLYNKKSCGYTTPHGGLLCGYKVNTTCAIIHELTHWVQGKQRRKFSEVETTANEIEYLKVNEPEWFRFLIKNN